VEKPDEPKLVEGAISGMVAALDPHSAATERAGLRECRETHPRAKFGGPLASR